ncbi:MAG: Mandelate racemase/muconate lactonizing protein [Candidatus Sulfotelmatobacter sp.]|nr:Mandelate racemase/muconate lactonizing protein [Candidatus Sulfotelmatobacter sp.]
METRDVRFPLEAGAGSDAVHSGAEYAFATTLLGCNGKVFGTGIVLTLGLGNQLVCQAIEWLGKELIGREIDGLMADFGTVAQKLAQHPQLRWLGPQKGVVHLALASLTNACFDLWAKSRGVPLWRLLLDLDAKQIVDLLDLSYFEDVLTRDEAEEILRKHAPSRKDREDILQRGYPGYDTSVGWFQYDDSQVNELARQAMDKGFNAFKLKVGSHKGERDVRRAFMLRELAGADALIMLDANQQWTLPRALEMCGKLRGMSPYFVEEPTHPDDIRAHRTIAEAIKPIPIALGEHVPNRIMFKNFMQAEAVQVVQVDCTRVAGISEFLTVSLLARKFGLRVVPHVGDMGQIHQHLVLFNHIAMGHEAVFLECIPHLQPHFVNPARIENGVYVTPQAPGSSSDLKGVRPGK